MKIYRAALGLIFLWALGLGLFWGPYSFSHLFSDGLSIFWNLRVPLVFSMMLSGWALALSGVVLQGIFRNPLADPALFGFSSGSSFAVVGYLALCALLGITSSHVILILPLIALLGAIFSMWVMLAFFSRLSDRASPMMLLFGVAWSIFLGAIGALMVIGFDEKGLRLLLWWSLGGQTTLHWNFLIFAFVLTAFASIGIFRERKRLDLLILGDLEVKSLGFSGQEISKRLLFCVAILTGVSVSLTGPIGFVGLLIPHMGRFLFGFSHRILLLSSGVLGMTLLLFAHVLGVMLVSPEEIPLGIATALLGVPFFVAICAKRRFVVMK